MATEVAITGTLEPGPGAANTGSILAVPTHVMYDAAGGVLVTLDGVEDALTTITGAFSLDLYANTDPTTNPTGTGYWFYHVSTNGKKRKLNTLPIIVPHDGGTPRQLSDLAEASSVELFGYASSAAFSAHLHGVPYFGKSGLYYASGVVMSTLTPTLDLLYCVPFYVPRDTDIDQLAVNITTASAPGALYRLGVYEDTGVGYPGDLLVDAGQVDVSTNGDKTVAVSETLPGGLVWFGLAAQGVTTATRSISTASYYLGGTGSIPTGNSIAYTEAGVSGVLPPTFTAVVTAATTAPRVWFRVA
jgi:hypothetical protein